MKIEVPVRSPVLNHHADRLVVGWVTTSESLLLNVFDFLLCSLPRERTSGWAVNIWDIGHLKGFQALCVCGMGIHSILVCAEQHCKPKGDIHIGAWKDWSA